MSAATQTRAAATTGGSGSMKGRAGFRGLLWLTWRQHRWPIIMGVAATAVMTIWMLVTAGNLADLAKTCPLMSCKSANGGSLNIAASFADYQMNAVVFLPVLFAVFWGVPLLAREYEQRTLPLAWSQDLSPLRWLWGKTAILGVVVAVLGTVLAATAEHVAHLYHAYTGKSLFEGTPYQAGGWLPLTLMLAWLAFGIAAGAATRRTMPAIAVVAGLWITRMVLMVRLRPNFMKPKDGFVSVDSMFRPVPSGAQMNIGGSSFPNDMMLNNGQADFVDSHGAQLSGHQVMDIWCGGADPQLAPGDKSKFSDPVQACLHQHDIIGTVTHYQPASRLGTFHLIENTANLGLLVVSLLIAWWCVRRTRTTT